MQLLIELQNLSIHSETDIIVHPLSLSIKAGETVTILGETGSGKSLLAQAIMGCLPNSLRSEGNIIIKGQAKNTKERALLWGKELAMLPQEPWNALDPVMTAINQVAEVHRFVCKKTKLTATQLANDRLMTLGLQNAKHQLPSQLSGGMAQRVAFATSTAAGATIIIADEPTKGLDYNHRNTIVKQLANQTKQGALLTITHDVAVAEQLGGQLIVMRNGQIIEQGLTADVLTNPREEYTQQLIAAHPKNWPQQENSSNFPTPLVTAKDIALSRGGKKLFNALSLDIHPGEIIGVCGDSGSGKSSLGELILGILSPDDGEITGQILPPWKKLKLYQDPPSAFADKVTLKELLVDVMHLHNIDTQELPPLLQQLQLAPELLERSINNVSGGELQRIALLRALLLKPKLLIADEPTSRLDPITAKSVTMILVNAARQHQCALLLISHDQQQLQKVCDKVINLHDYNRV